MVPLIKHVLWSLLFDEAAARRWGFGFLTFLVTLASMVFVDGVEVAFTWTGRQWAAKVLTCVIAMAFGMINPAGKVPKTQAEPSP